MKKKVKREKGYRLSVKVDRLDREVCGCVAVGFHVWHAVGQRLNMTQSRKNLARNWRKERGVKKRGKFDSKNERGATLGLDC